MVHGEQSYKILASETVGIEVKIQSNGVLEGIDDHQDERQHRHDE